MQSFANTSMLNRHRAPSLPGGTEGARFLRPARGLPQDLRNRG